MQPSGGRVGGVKFLEPPWGLSPLGPGSPPCDSEETPRPHHLRPDPAAGAWSLGVAEPSLPLQQGTLPGKGLPGCQERIPCRN